MQVPLICEFSHNPDLQGLLLEAGRLEEAYDWGRAVELYERILAIIPESSPNLAILNERCGYATYRRGMQASNSLEFRENLSKAVDRYSLASKILHRQAPKDTTGILRQEAFVSFLSYWLAAPQQEKSQTLESAWASTRECLKRISQSDPVLDHMVTYNQLSVVPWLHYFFLKTKEERIRMLEEAVQFGEHLIRTLPQLLQATEQARCYLRVSALINLLGGVDPDNTRSYVQKSREYWKKAKELSEETALVEAYLAGGGPDFEDSMEGGIKSCETIIPYVQRTGDNFMIGLTYDWLSMYEALRAPIIEDSRKATVLLNQALGHAEEANAHYRLVSMISPRSGMLWAESPLPEYLLTMSWFESETPQKRASLAKAEKGLLDLLRLARASLYPDSIADAHHVSSKTLLFLSKLEQSKTRKRELLRRALWHRKESIRVWKESTGDAGINAVLPVSYLGDVKFELAKTCTNPRTARRFIEEAIQDKVSALTAHSSDQNIVMRETIEDYYHHWSAKVHFEAGTFLDYLYEITAEDRDLRKAAAEYLEAAKSFEILQHPSRVAECHRSAAQCYSMLAEHTSAAGQFEQAEKWYERAGPSIPGLASIYRDHMTYMSAWNRIEKARESHSQQQYAPAADLYEEAAQLLKSNQRWAYLSSEYQALSKLELAEDKSRREMSDEAATEFEAASRVFSESLILIQMRLKDLTDIQEVQLALELLKKSPLRAEYCKARTEIEKARLLTKRGNHKASRERYERAIEILARIAGQMPPGPEKKETQFVTKLARAWQTMVRAEEEVSPDLYIVASELFSRSKDLSPSENGRLLVLGHSNYCNALERAARYLEKGKMSEQAAASRHLENATNYYLKAGFQNASELAIATRRLLEGHVQVDIANRETDAGKKAQIFASAEKILRSALDTYNELGEVAKRDDVLRILERVKDDKDLAMSFMVKIAAPVILSSQTIPITEPSKESALGVEVFRSAYVQANLGISPSSPRIGEPLSLKIEFANAGMSPAQLVRLERIIPDGFELMEKPTEFPVQEHHLIMKGRRLDPLKTDQLSLVLKPRIEGSIALSPRVLYLDENGQDRIHEPSPLEFVVRDHASADLVASSLPHETLESSPIMKFLTNCFVEDYMQRRFSSEHAGWRGLPDIVRSLNIARSQVYGDLRYRHTFGKPLEKLVKRGIVEFRIFPGSRGRGGNVVKVRVAYEKEPVKRVVDALALTLPK